MSKARIIAAALTLSATALVGIATHEGFRADTYADAVGVPTIGFGTTDQVQPGQTISVERALIRLLDDAENHAAAVRRCAPVPLYQHEFDAFVSLTYNIGAGAFCSSTLARQLNARNYVAACAEILRWNRAGGRVLPGLVKRRQAEYRQCTGQGAQ